MKKVYISGRITGIDNFEQLFAKAEAQLKQQGFETVNPVTLPHNHDKTWHQYMREDIKALCDCDIIFMLNNFNDSRGAKIELELAVNLGMDVIYQS